MKKILATLVAVVFSTSAFAIDISNLSVGISGNYGIYGANGKEETTIKDSDRVWVAVDGMGGDHAPASILDGCLKSLSLLPLRIKFVGEIEKVKKAAIESGLQESLNEAIDTGNFELIPSGPSVGMDEEATAVRKKKDASINIAMKLVKEGKALSHEGKGWEIFTSEVIKFITVKNKGLCFLLWGKYAHDKEALIQNKELQHIIRTSHPSPLSARRKCGKELPFLGSGCFASLEIFTEINLLGCDSI